MTIGLRAVLGGLSERAGFHLTIRIFQTRVLAERLAAIGGSKRKVVAHLRRRIVRDQCLAISSFLALNHRPTWPLQMYALHARRAVKST